MRWWPRFIKADGGLNGATAGPVIMADRRKVVGED